LLSERSKQNTPKESGRFCVAAIANYRILYGGSTNATERGGGILVYCYAELRGGDAELRGDFSLCFSVSSLCFSV